MEHTFSSPIFFKSLIVYILFLMINADNFLGFEEAEGEDEFREEYACPFCSDYFDIVSLCCHIDEDHPMDTINGVDISSVLFCNIKNLINVSSHGS